MKKIFEHLSANKLLKFTMLAALAGGLVISSTALVMAKKPDSSGGGSSGGGSSSKSCLEADYPQRNSSTCEITDNAEVLPGKQLVIFHYTITDMEWGKGSDQERTIDTSDVCVTSAGKIYAVPDIANCNGTVYPSRTYFYVSGNLNDGKGLYHTQYNANGDDVTPIPGAFRIYGNPEGGAAQEFKFHGGVCVHAFIHAPMADTGIKGGGNGCGIIGAVWANSWGVLPEVQSQSNAKGAAINVPDNISETFGYDIMDSGKTGSREANRISGTQNFEFQEVE